MRSFDQKVQSDIAIWDFSHAFDTVPHEHLLGKLDYYGMLGPILHWIRAFLCGRQMWVAIDGECSAKAHMCQVCVKGLYLVLCYFYSLLTTSLVKYLQALSLSYLPTTALFTEKSHQMKLMSFSNEICQPSAKRWGIRFNPSKC